MALFGSSQNTSSLGAFSFGTPASATTASSFSSFGSNPSSNTLAGSSAGFVFGCTPPTSSSQSLFSGSSFPAPAASSGLSFGQTTAAAAPSFGLFGASTTMAAPQPTFGVTPGLSTGLLPAAPTAPANKGLGGVDLQSASISGPEVANKKDKAVKETFIPNEILATFQEFKKFTKDQKTLREEMNRMSTCGKDIVKVQNRISLLKRELATVSNGIQRNASLIAKLKQDTADETRYADIIRCTKDTPSALQYENTAPSAYFHNLVANFENQMQKYRQQIEELERHLASLSQPGALTANELSSVMKRLHDAFVTLASQLQVVHQRVMHLREEVLSTVDPNQANPLFQNRKNAALNEKALLSLVRPVVPEKSIGQPDLKLSITYMSIRPEQQLRDLAAGNHNLLNKSNSSLGLQQNSSFNALGQPSNLSFGSPSLGGSFLSDNNCQTPFGVNNQKPFMLQKPPSGGNKRNKRWTNS